METRDQPEETAFGTEAVDLPIEGTLDLHTFRPGEVKDLVPGYLEECRRRGILEVRIIHGKGSGQLRERVRSILRRTPGVLGYADGGEGNWGATVVSLAPPAEEITS